MSAVERVALVSRVPDDEVGHSGASVKWIKKQNKCCWRWCYFCFHSTYCGWLHFTNQKTGVDPFVAANVIQFQRCLRLPDGAAGRVNNNLFRRKVSFGPRPDQDCWQVRSAGDHGGTEKKVDDGRGNRKNDIPIDPWHAVDRAVGRFLKDAGRSGKIRNWPCSTFHQSVEPSMDGWMKVTSQSTERRRNWHDGVVSISQLQDVLRLEDTHHVGLPQHVQLLLNPNGCNYPVEDGHGVAARS